MALQGFVSYAREDERLRKQLDAHLSSLKDRISFDLWHDQHLLAGDEREPVLRSRMESARIHLLLISADYLASDACQLEMEQALALKAAGQARVIAIIVRSVAWENTRLANLQVLPRNRTPVTSWSNQDEAWHDVTEGIRAVLEEEVARDQSASPRPEPLPPRSPPDPVRSLLQGLPRGVGHDVGRFLDYYLGSGGVEGPSFGGRDADLQTLDHWLDDPGAPKCLLVTGPGGRGKSALLAHWVSRLSAREGLDIAFFPISVRFGTNRAGLLYHALAARLSRLRGKAPPREQDTSVELLREVVSGLLSDPSRERQLLVVIDALDEAADLELATSLFPVRLPQGVRVVLSSRPRPGERIPWLRQLGWDQHRSVRLLQLERLDARGVADALVRLPPALDPIRQHPGFAAELFRLSEGDPLVLYLYLQWLEEHPAVREPGQLPAKKPGLDHYFEGWLEEQRELWGPRAPDQEPRVQRLLALLSCALGPLNRQELLLLLGEETGLTFDATLKSLSRLIIGDDESGYAFTHPGLGEYFQAKLSAAARHRYEGELLDWGERTVRSLEAGMLKPKDVPRYLVRYYAAHLERSGAEPEALLRLVSKAWHRASVARERTDAVFLEDVSRALHAVRRRNEARVMAGALPELSEEIRCAAVRTSLHSLARRLTPFLISSLVENKLWSVEVAWAHARHEPSPQVRCLGLLALARHSSEPLRSEILGEVLDTIFSMDEEHWRNASIQELAPQLSTVLMAQAVTRIEALRNANERALTLAVLAHHAPEWAQRTLVPRALELARLLEGYDRETVIVELGTKLIEAHGEGAPERPTFGRARTTELDAQHFLSLASDEDFLGLRANALASLDMSWKWHVAVEVPDLPASLPPETIRAILASVRANCSDEGYATALEILASRLEGVLLEDAVRMARQLGSPHARSKLLAVLSYRFSSSRRLELLREALESARSLADVGGLAAGLWTLTAPLSESRRNVVLSGALDTIHALAPGRGRLMDLASLVSVLPRSKREPVLSEVLRDAEAASSPSTWVDVIEALGPAAEDPRLWNALERLNPLPPVIREKLLALAGPHLPEQWLEGALEFALEESFGFLNFLTVEQRAVLTAIASRLPEWLQARAVTRIQAMKAGRALEEYIEILGPFLPERLMRPLIAISQKMLREKRAFILASFLPRLPVDEQPTVLQEVFDLLLERPHSYDYSHARALRVLAPHLTERLLSQAVDILRTLRPYDRTDGLIVLAPFSSKAVAALRQHALSDAQAVERDGFRPGERAGVSAGLLARLGPWLEMPQVLEALQLAKKLEDLDARVAAVTGLLPVLPAPEWEEAVELALRDEARSKYGLRKAAVHAVRLPPRRLYPLLSDILAKTFSSVTREQLYGALAVLAPVLNVLGGEEDLVRSIQTLLDIETWWS